MSPSRRRVTRFSALIPLVTAAALMAGPGHTQPAHAAAAGTAACSTQTNELQFCGTPRVSWLTNPGGSGVYDNTGKYRFSQTLTTINYPFQDTAPYTDHQTNGHNVPAQNSKWNVGSGGNVYPFEANFTGTLYANVPPGGGNLTFQITSDDGWILGFGPDADGDGQPTGVGTDQFNLPATTPNKGYPVQAGINFDNISTTNETIYFPEPGPYPFELDSTENSSPPYAIIFADSSGNPIDNS
jgi:hypothetical protein